MVAIAAAMDKLRLRMGVLPGAGGGMGARPRRGERAVSSLVDADVVHEHAGRERGGGVDRAGEVAADRQVEDEVERVVEDPRPAGRLDGGLAGVEDLVAVEQELDALAVPLRRP